MQIFWLAEMIATALALGILLNIGVFVGLTALTIRWKGWRGGVAAITATGAVSWAAWESDLALEIALFLIFLPEMV